MKANRRPSLVARLSASVVLLASVSPAAASEDWRRFESESGRFSVDFPTAPVEGERKSRFPIASFVSHVYTALVGDDGFGVNHTDIPRLALLFASTARILDGTRKGFLKDANASEVSFEETSLNNREARELVYDIPAQNGRPPLRGRAAMLLEGKRLYVFWAEVTATRAERDLKRFFESAVIQRPK